MRICLVGCCHGSLNLVYEQAARHSPPPDLVLIAGDFQAVRDEQDLESMAVPRKYRSMGDFKQYYKGQKKAPILTIVIGGNHEASRYMVDMPHGGWLAKNIYYLGTCGVVDVGDVTIGGISGVYAPEHYLWPRFEKFPFDSQTIRSVYHTRHTDVAHLVRLGRGKIDVMMSHDWPAGIEQFGDLEWLRQKKRFLRQDIDRHRLGSPAARQLLDVLQPHIWLSAHLHVFYEAAYPRDNPVTAFVALDKALPRRKFLKVIDIPGEMGKLKVNEHWSTILSDSHASTCVT